MRLGSEKPQADNHTVSRMPITVPDSSQMQTVKPASAKCNFVRKPYANLPHTPVALASASKYFQMLPASLWRFAKCSQSVQEHSQVLLKAPAVMKVHSGCYEI